MSRPSAICLVLVYLLSLTAAGLNAADNVFKEIPDSALGVVYVNDVGRANENVGRVARLLGQEAPPLLELLKGMSGIRKGFDDKGTLALAVLAQRDAEPRPVLFVPTTDYEQLVKQLNPADPEARVTEVAIGNQEAVITKKGGFAVVAAAQDRPLLESVLESREALDDRVEALREFIQAGDAGVVITRRGVEIAMQRAIGLLDTLKQQLGSAGPETQPAVMALGVYESMFKAIQRNVTNFAITVRVAESGNVHLASRTLVRPECNFAELAKAVQPSESHLLSGLPAGPFVMAFGGRSAANWGEGMMKWSIEMWRSMGIAEKLTEKEMKQLAEAGAQAMQGVRAMSFVMSVGERDEPLYGRMYLAFQADNAKAYLDRYYKAVVAMREFTKDGAIPFYGEMNIEKIKIDETDALKVSMKFGEIPGGDEEELQEMFKKMFGADGMLFYLAAADETTVVGAYTSQEQLTRALRAAKSGKRDLSADEQIAATAKLLPGGSQWVVYVSPKGCLDFAKLAIDIFSPGGGGPMFPEFPACPPIGFGAKITAQGVETDLVVPAATLTAIGQFAKRVGDSEVDVD